MTDDKMRPKPNDRSEPAMPEQSGHDAQQQQAGVPDAPARGGQPPARGRKPLFRS
jgi:hypothetical protein